MYLYAFAEYMIGYPALLALSRTFSVNLRYSKVYIYDPNRVKRREGPKIEYAV